MLQQLPFQQKHFIDELIVLVIFTKGYQIPKQD